MATKEQQALCDLFDSPEMEDAVKKWAAAVPDPRAFLEENGIVLAPEVSVRFEIASVDPTDVPPRPACTRQCWRDSNGREICVVTCV